MDGFKHGVHVMVRYATRYRQGIALVNRRVMPRDFPRILHQLKHDLSVNYHHFQYASDPTL